MGGHGGQGGDYRFGEFGGSGFAAEVAGDAFGFAVYLFEGGFDALGGGLFAQVLEHHDAAHEQGRGISEAFAGDVGAVP